MTPASLPDEPADDSNGPVLRLACAGLAAVIMLGAFGSWKSLADLRRKAAEDAGRDEDTIQRLEAEVMRLSGRKPAASPVAATPLQATEARPAPAGTRTEGLGFLIDLANRGYFATPQPMTMLRQLNGYRNPNLQYARRPAYMIDASGQLDEGFGEFFGLSAEADTALRTGMAEWNAEIERALRASTTVQRQQDGSVVLQVSPLTEATAFRDRFDALLRQALGRERFAAFQAFNGTAWFGENGQFPAMLTGNTNFFGEGTAMYTLRKPDATRLSVSYTLKSASGSSGGAGSSSSAASTPEAMRESLLRTYGPVMKLLPADF